MSAPNTNVEKQQKRHAGPLVGIVAGVAFVAVILLGFVFFTTGGGDEDVDVAIPADAESNVLRDVPPPQVNAPPSDAVVPDTR